MNFESMTIMEIDDAWKQFKLSRCRREKFGHLSPNFITMNERERLIDVLITRQMDIKRFIDFFEVNIKAKSQF
jgi:hypothetical protein